MLKIILLILFILSVPLPIFDRIHRIEEEEVLPKDRQGRWTKHDTGTAKMAVAPEAAASAVALFRVGGS